ncbi:hypothetical protein AVI48_16335 (plasmid) [Piscirickettsia salmonis]|nr:hypothetical protein AVI48_16335 [Piscirickettsia salmonis]
MSVQHLSLGARVWLADRQTAEAPLSSNVSSWRLDETLVKIKGFGITFIEPLINMAILWTGCSADSKNAKAAMRFFKRQSPNLM